MSLVPRLFLPLLFVAAPGLHAAAQTDTIGFGGPEGEDLFDELTGEEEFEPAVGLTWDVNDSLSFIPGYDIYCHWNTDAIFHAATAPRVMHDTLRLHLVREDRGHALPCNGHVTSPFGPRRGRMHYGVDLKLETGDPVVTAFAGMVRISKYNPTFGHVVVVRHHNGLETLYAHLSKRLVKPGDRLDAGDTLGLGGNTGRSYGSHLHFEVRFLDQPIDPTEIFDLSSGELKAGTFDIHAGTFAAIAAARAAAAARKYHVVRPGESLSVIARRYGTSVNVLCKLNGIGQRSVLRVGQRLRYN